ncbi:MAG TPA: hypothetical protein VGD99_21010 [Anaerolineae bacterium]
MTSKQKKSKVRKVKPRSQAGQTGGWFGLNKYGLIMGVVVLAVIVVAGTALLDRASRRSSQASNPLADVSLDKSEGAADAPVVVVAYGDFQ